MTFVFSIHPFSPTKQGVSELLLLPLDLVMLPGRRDWMAKPPHLAPFHAKELLQSPQMSELLPPSPPLTPSPATIRLRGTSFRLLVLEDTTQSSHTDGQVTPRPNTAGITRSNL